MPDPVITITVDGQPALTAAQAAARYGVALSSIRSAITRAKGRITAVAELDGRTALYLVEQFDALWAARPGRGAPGVPKPAKPRRAARAKAAG